MVLLDKSVTIFCGIFEKNEICKKQTLAFSYLKGVLTMPVMSFLNTFSGRLDESEQEPFSTEAEIT